MTKTPDEIKKGLEYCSVPDDTYCAGCAFAGADCLERLCGQALALIRQLQDENTKKDATIQQLESGLLAQADVIATMGERIQQLEAERDAAVKDIKEAHDSFCGCVTCKNYRVNADCHEPPSTFCPNCSHDDCPCKGCSSKLENWQWRGVQKEAP